MTFVKQLPPAFVLVLIQFLAALPWLWAMDPKSARMLIRKPATWGNLVGALLGVTALVAFLMVSQKGSNLLQLLGRTYGSVLHLQLAVDFFIAAFAIVLFVWPKGGAVALSSFREGVRQPMFWLIALAAFAVFLIATVVPYFTFGDDYKMMKQICFDVTMLGALVFGVLAASISINEEIEGRTAVTLMSKPVTRRQFLVGKFVGIAFAALALTLLAGWAMNWALYIQPRFNPLDEVVDQMPAQAQDLLRPWFSRATTPETAPFMVGLNNYLGDAWANGIGNLLGFGKVIVLVAIAATLATRMPMITNLVICLGVFFLGHLAPVLRRVSEQLRSQNPDNTALSLVNFLTQLLETITPALEFFDMGPAIIRDTPINLMEFMHYVGSVSVYALVYTTIALLVGLILFEDRDLA